MIATRVMSIRCALAGLFLMVLAGSVQAVCETGVGRFVSITGSVDVQPSGGETWNAASLDTRLCEGDTIRVGERSRAAVALINDAVLRIDQNTAMRLVDITPQEEETSLLDVFSGAIQSFSRKPKFLRVSTPYLNGSVEGTEFAVRVDDDSAAITVFEGVVMAANDQGEVAVNPGESAQAAKGQAPQRSVVVKPRDQVQWALYYPTILSASALADASPALREAAEKAANGDTAAAFSALDRVPTAQRDANYLALRASLLLSVGQVDAARDDIEAALAQDAQSAEAYALRSVIGVAQNEREAALTDARRAVELDPASSAANIALSYALQSKLQLDEARSVLLATVEQQPIDALVWARLAELHLALGDRKAATAAAQRAVELQPGLGRTQNVLGFAALAEIRPKQAQAAFEQAIALDSADPLPHLGLGLAKIRQGQLDAGRAELEAAVALDSNNALLRAYLGKAYFEEKRSPLDAQQFGIAKELDPLDPTAFFYNAIALQTENRPVEALRELEESIERNDNRAVYRSRLLLDQDRAARGSSLARVYNDLGFTESGLNEAKRSLILDPANAAAHRFLSDNYRNVRRREISRVSELLQAQLFQDVNVNPIQPSNSSTNLNIIAQGGPANAGFNEFTPLFERNRTRLDVSAALGNNDTTSGEAVVSALYDGLSLSAGAFYYDTDGFRPNNDLRHNIYNLFGQYAISQELNLQFEFNRRETSSGDLEQNFDPSIYREDYTRDLDLDVARLGLRYSPNPESDLVFSFIHAERDESQVYTQPFGEIDIGIGFPLMLDFSTDTRLRQDAEQYEAQYVWQGNRFNIVAGVGYADVDGRLDETDTFVVTPPIFPEEVTVSRSDPEIQHLRGYVYANVVPAQAVQLTLGLSADDYDETGLEQKKVNPKVGLQWDLTDTLHFRAAALQTIKPALVANRTVEPTQVAGFNQFYDDVNATKAKVYGVALDAEPVDTVAAGVEMTWRDLSEPVFGVDGDAVFEDRDEANSRGYLYWTPSEKVAVTGELIYDRYESGDSIRVDLPSYVRTVSVPLHLRYFHPRGFFGGIGVSYVDQKVERPADSIYADGEDDFFVVDASVGYRLPDRRGIVSLEVQNLFDQDFFYQDDNFREFSDEPSSGPYVPDRLILARLLLHF